MLLVGVASIAVGAHCADRQAVDSVLTAGERSPWPDAVDSMLCERWGWQDLHRVFPVLRTEDDGFTAEVISEFVVSTLAGHWESLPQLSGIVQADPAFGSWVLSHIDATTDCNDLAQIIHNAQAGGPPRHVGLRRRILAAARQALADVRATVGPCPADSAVPSGSRPQGRH